MKTDEIRYDLILSITKNYRLNIKSISRELGLNYVTTKRKINKMMSNGYFTVKPMVSAKLTGLTAGLVRIKNPPPWILKFSTHCNRVLAYFNTSNEVVLLIYGRDKHDIVEYINRIMEETDEFLEFTIEFGKFPITQLIPIKNVEQSNVFCSNHLGCKLCIVNNCLNNSRNKI